jgi:hypothetical protein
MIAEASALVRGLARSEREMARVWVGRTLTRLL